MLQKWDYCSLWLNEVHEYGYFTTSSPHGTESIEVRPGGREDFLEFRLRTLSKLGAQGWELVGCATAANQGETLYFKRLISESTPATRRPELEVLAQKNGVEVAKRN